MICNRNEPPAFARRTNTDALNHHGHPRAGDFPLRRRFARDCIAPNAAAATTAVAAAVAAVAVAAAAAEAVAAAAAADLHVLHVGRRLRGQRRPLDHDARRVLGGRRPT